MFEHFGLKDAFLAVWKYKWVIFCCSVCIAFVGGYAISNVYVKNEPAVLSPDVIQDTKENIEYYELQNRFYLEYYGKDESITSLALSNMYLETIHSYSCNQFVSDYILSRMSKEEIISRLGVTYSPADITLEYFEQFISATVDTTGQGFIMLVRSGDLEYASLVLDAYMQWINELAGRENSQVGIVMLDKSVETVLLQPVEKYTILEAKDLSVEIVYILFFFIALVVLSIGAMGIQFFNPTLNRKTDFEEYGIKVLGEIRV